MASRNTGILDYAKNWGCGEGERLPLLLFVQRARELLLHTSSMLVRKMHASPFSIARELHFILYQHKRTPHSSTEVNAKFLISEFNEALRDDAVARSLVGDRLDFINQSFSGVDDINNKLEVIELTLARLAQGRYLTMCAEGVLDIVKSGGSEKKRLLALTEGFVLGVRDAGYPAQTIYHLLNVAFLDKKRSPVSADEMLNGFFSYFDLEQHEYKVYIGVSDVHDGKEEIFKSIDAKYMDSSSTEVQQFMDRLPASTRRFFSEVAMDGIVVIDPVKALDPQSARQAAEKHMRLLDDLLRFSGHRAQFKLNNPALVVQVDKDAKFVHSNRPKSAVLRMPHVHEGGNDLRDIAAVLRSTKSSSRQRFLRAVELHGTALSSPEEESQLLNLWIAFETLFVTGAHGSKVSEVLASATPYVAGCWIGYELQELWAEVDAKHREEWRGAISESEIASKYDDESVRFIAAIALRKFEKEMTNFLGSLDGNPLLRCKIFGCIEWAQSPKKILRHLDEVRSRVSVDINRIYRYRNQLVHIGQAIGDLGAVVQSAHQYLDLVLNLLILMLGKTGGPRTIEQANIEIKIKEDRQRALLEANSKAEREGDDESFLLLLTGRPLLA
ncbi:hypothetical protein LMG18091_01752 [Ralstonia wenshanensis]|uniref:Apea-like HEPN domain-containing protein n=1 Tax=Ralstonia wenshanensis TaxID=2842456 RepID=A0AAD2EPT1_9RALS|nr:hypothetical protein LMG18091_01752 [Ralstonia wenshanensis]